MLEVSYRNRETWGLIGLERGLYDTEWTEWQCWRGVEFWREEREVEGVEDVEEA